MAPSEFEKWSARDRHLAEALYWHEFTRNAHGIPFEVATDPENEGAFKIDARVDYSMQALATWNKEHGEVGSLPVVSLDQELASEDGRKSAAARQRELRERARKSRASSE